MVLVNIESISTLLSDLDKSLIIIVWVLNGLSILFGIIQLYLDHLFFRKYSRILETVTGKISRREFQTELEMNEYIKEIHKPLKKNSNTNWMFLQAFTILSSLIILIFIAGGLLYK